MKIGVTKLDISLPALMSILALVILVGISCVNEDLNVGFLGIAFGIIVGGIFGDTTPWKNSLLIPSVSAKVTLL